MIIYVSDYIWLNYNQWNTPINNHSWLCKCISKKKTKQRIFHCYLSSWSIQTFNTPSQRLTHQKNINLHQKKKRKKDQKINASKKTRQPLTARAPDAVAPPTPSCGCCGGWKPHPPNTLAVPAEDAVPSAQMLQLSLLNSILQHGFTQ